MSQKELQDRPAVCSPGLINSHSILQHESSTPCAGKLMSNGKQMQSGKIGKGLNYKRCKEMTALYGICTQPCSDIVPLCSSVTSFSILCDRVFFFNAVLEVL